MTSTGPPSPSPAGRGVRILPNPRWHHGASARGTRQAWGHGVLGGRRGAAQPDVLVPRWEVAGLGAAVCRGARPGTVGARQVPSSLVSSTADRGVALARAERFVWSKNRDPTPLAGTPTAPLRKGQQAGGPKLGAGGWGALSWCNPTWPSFRQTPMSEAAWGSPVLTPLGTVG